MCREVSGSTKGTLVNPCVLGHGFALPGTAPAVVEGQRFVTISQE